ncbi:LytTR family DNA-binding domain-containing protein [Luteibacter aegosomatis]|uniref:LytR/AlgR family response regulator transcription factor n=1 Tax=Luteibacter aegosomatis TaxID=2911537 RepID=UPI001FF89315|nr:LytTR family DNA-binding domain-containing protein [Luteibacter aegosomatis]UPG85627.1 LytTR family DNA-binding domain-containing protein [Luteibacter aegosomatis]
MRVLVVDDEPLSRRGVCLRLARHDDVAHVHECGDGESALALLRDHAFDVAFLDVRMPGISGFDVLDRLPPERRPLAVMLTAYDQYALRAFEAAALDYLLKPIDDARFDEALSRVRSRLGRVPNGDAMNRYARSFTARLGHRDVVVRADDVEWIEASGDYVGLHVGDKTHLVRQTMQQIERRLDPKRFIRIHRSTIVRIDRVAELEALSNRDCLVRLSDGVLVRASRSYVGALRSSLGI